MLPKTNVDFLVLGASGMQGSLVVRDIIEHGFSVFASDLYEDPRPLGGSRKRPPFARLDLRDVEALVELIERCGAKVVVNCAEGDWNLNVYLASLQTRRHCMDLGSQIDVTRKQIALHEEFKKISRTAITGCGSTPGINNVMMRHAEKNFDTIDTIQAGFAWDSNLKQFVVPFSMESVLEEITEPAPYLSNGQWKKAMPMKTLSSHNHRRIGFQNEFLVHHPETFTFSHYIKEVKNVRFYAGFPEHSLQTIKMLAQLGFNDRKPVQVRGQDVIPIEFLSRLLKRLKTPAGYQEFEVLWVEMDGVRDGKPHRTHMECLVPTLPELEQYGCNVDTALPASIIAQMLRTGVIKAPGSFAPEAIVPEKKFFSELKKHRMLVYEDGVLIN